MYTTDTIELRKLMIDAGINTVTELAEKSGINRKTLGSVLNGAEKPTSAVMEKLVFFFNLQPEEAGRIFFKPTLRDE